MHAIHLFMCICICQTVYFNQHYFVVYFLISSKSIFLSFCEYIEHGLTVGFCFWIESVNCSSAKSGTNTVILLYLMFHNSHLSNENILIIHLFTNEILFRGWLFIWADSDNRPYYHTMNDPIDPSSHAFIVLPVNHLDFVFSFKADSLFFFSVFMNWFKDAFCYSLFKEMLLCNHMIIYAYESSTIWIKTFPKWWFVYGWNIWGERLA